MVERRQKAPSIKFKTKIDGKGILIISGSILSVPESGGRKIVFRIEGGTVSWVWVVSYTITWLVKHGYKRSAEHGEDNLAFHSMELIRFWLKRGLTGDKEILVHIGARDGVPRGIVRKRRTDPPT